MEPVNCGDFEEQARSKLSAETYDFIAGGAGDEWTLAENCRAWARLTVRPRVLVDVSQVDTTTTVLGAPVSMPLLLAPVGGLMMAHPDGDLASARAAAKAGVGVILSCAASSTIEDVAAAAPDAPRWFQLYIQPDRAGTAELVRRAEQAGYRAICLTVDSPRYGIRDRELRHGERLLRQFVPPANLAGARFGAGYRHRAVTWDDVDWLVSATSTPLVIKGIVTAEDARIAVERGVAGIVVSNHGGRQLDGAIATADALPEVVDAVAGRAEVYVDGGITRGVDVLRALALGARAVLVGRAFVWALAAAGEDGVAAALGMLRAELETAMALSGCPTVGDITRDYVRFHSDAP
jgi:4-hydroxymandelate oxidase